MKLSERKNPAGSEKSVIRLQNASSLSCAGSVSAAMRRYAPANAHTSRTATRVILFPAGHQGNIMGKAHSTPWSRRGGCASNEMTQSHRNGAAGVVGSTTDYRM